jgi:large subunit ribosomal protein L18
MIKDQSKQKILARARRHKRIRGRISGTMQCPRLSIFRSSKHVELQLIDDETGKTLFSVLSAAGGSKGKSAKTKTDAAREAAKLLAQKAVAKGILKVVFDRGGYEYHGRVKAAADGAREGGLQF